MKLSDSFRRQLKQEILEGLKDIPPDQWRAYANGLIEAMKAQCDQWRAEDASPIKRRERKAKLRAERTGKVRLVHASAR